MRLWTIQTFCVYELIQKEGVYRCAPNKSQFTEVEEYVSAYKWISDQMKFKIGPPPKGVIYPVWAWYMYDGKNVGTNIMWQYDEVVNKSSILLEIEVPKEAVLLTDFLAWHMVLDDIILYKANYIDSINDDEIEREIDIEEEYYDSLPEDEKERYKKKSWEQIFCTPETSLSYVQATFWELKSSQIVKAWKK